jgi:hypothetical protein
LLEEQAVKNLEESSPANTGTKEPGNDREQAGRRNAKGVQAVQK